MRDNRLRLNPDKTEILCVGDPSVCGLGATLSFFGGGTLSMKDEVRSFGMLLDPLLSMTSQIVSVV